MVAVAYKKPKGRKVYVEQFDLINPDPINKLKGTKYIPLGSEILDMGVGERFYNDYKKKWLKQ